MRVELMAAIYDKALKRQDYSGIIDKDKAKEAADKKAAHPGSGFTFFSGKREKQCDKP